jgi:hypothetical protein
MPSSEEAQQLAALLLALTQPDTQGIRQAEVALKPLLKDPRCVSALVEILKARGEQVRVMSRLSARECPRDLSSLISSLFLLFRMTL